MELEVFWTHFAEEKLVDIFEYYKYKAGSRIAQKIVNGIVDETILLEKNPYLGQFEELLEDRFEEYRYLVYENYKIIYWIDNKKNMVVIAHVFDTRQNPIKLKKMK